MLFQQIDEFMKRLKEIKPLISDTENKEEGASVSVTRVAAATAAREGNARAAEASFEQSSLSDHKQYQQASEQLHQVRV